MADSAGEIAMIVLFACLLAIFLVVVTAYTLQLCGGGSGDCSNPCRDQCCNNSCSCNCNCSSCSDNECCDQCCNALGRRRRQQGTQSRRQNSPITEQASLNPEPPYLPQSMGDAEEEVLRGRTAATGTAAPQAPSHQRAYGAVGAMTTAPDQNLHEREDSVNNRDETRPPPSASGLPKNDYSSTSFSSQGRTSCVVCLTSRPKFCAVPCGHVCLCAECSKAMPPKGNCPLCRSSYTQIIEVYV